MREVSLIKYGLCLVGKTLCHYRELNRLALIYNIECTGVALGRASAVILSQNKQAEHAVMISHKKGAIESSFYL